MKIANAFKETAYYRTIEAVSPDERLLCVVKQHPAGIVGIYIIAIVAFTGGLALISLLLPATFGSSSSALYAVWALVALLSGAVLLVVLMLSTYVYNQSRLTVTDKNVVHIMQRGIFNRKVSHLSLANVEDVTASQNGLVANNFDFGTIHIETAGEQTNFTFPMCPQPNRVSRIILEAKQDFLRTTGQTGSYRNAIPRHPSSTPDKT